jgi:hypothetical protein
LILKINIYLKYNYLENFNERLVNFRKILGNPSKEQKKILLEEYNRFMKMAEDMLNESNENDKKRIKKENSTCPHCGNKDSKKLWIK